MMKDKWYYMHKCIDLAFLEEPVNLTLCLLSNVKEEPVSKLSMKSAITLYLILCAVREIESNISE